MSSKKIKQLKRKIKQTENRLMLEFFDSLKYVGIVTRTKVCFKIFFTNFRLTNKKGGNDARNFRQGNKRKK